MNANLSVALLVLMRASGILVAAPMLGSRSVPARLRLGIALWLTAACAPLVRGNDSLASATDMLMWLAGAEVLFGLSVGFAARIAFEAGYAVAQTLGLGAGFGFSALLDPNSGAPSTAFGQLATVVTLGIAGALGFHTDVVVWFVDSLVSVPPGSLTNPATFMAHAAAEAVAAINLTMRLCVPALFAVTMAHLMTGLLQRAVPNAGFMHVAFVGPLMAALWALSQTVMPHAVLSVREAVRALPGSG